MSNGCIIAHVLLGMNEVGKDIYDVENMMIMMQGQQAGTGAQVARSIRQ